jgi:hypothetical protein
MSCDQDLTLDNVLTSSTPSESTPIYLPGVHLEPPGEYFDTAAKVAVAIGTTVVVLALLAVGGYCFYRKRKRAKRARRTGRKETTQPIATPFQSATRHPMALTSVDEERKMFQSASRQPIALTSVDEELRIESPKKNQSPTKKWPLVSPKSDPKDTKPVQSPASRRQTRPLERPVLMGTHELEQPQPELETPVLRRRPSELDGRMIYPSGTTEVDSIVEETPLTRRARTTRDEVGSEHWTFLRDSSATDLME